MTIKAFGSALIAFLASSIPLIAQSYLLNDDFAGSTLNTSNWLPRTSTPDSTVTVNNGLILTNGSAVLSQTSLPSQIQIDIVFQFTGTIHDSFKIYTRTGSTFQAAFHQYNPGLYASFSMMSDTGGTSNNISLEDDTAPGTQAILANGTIPLVQGQTYFARIIETASAISLYVNDFSKPLITATSSNSYGSLVGLVNREGAAAGSSISEGSQVTIKAFSVSTGNPTASPSILTQPQSLSVASGSTATFAVGASGNLPLSFQWAFNGAEIAGATGPSYTISNAQATNAGSYSVTVTNSSGAVTSNPSTLTVTTALLSKLINVSTLGSGGFTMGFVVGGNTPKTVLVRGVGPTLTTFGVQNPASQTTLTLYSGSTVIGTNAAWGTASNAAQTVGAGGSFPLLVGSQDSALLVTLSPGPYTAQVTANGAVLLEVYDIQ
jgi:hypothetical protein